MVALPVTFSRTGGSKAVGCLVYVVSVPFIIIFLSLFITTPILFGLEALGLPHERFEGYFLLIYPPVGLWTVVWARRDYRRRADFAVTIRRDRLVVELGRRTDDVPFAEVESIRLVPARLDLACVLVRRGGGPLRLSPEVAPFSSVRDALEETLVSDLVRRLDRRLAAGESVPFRDPLPRSMGAIAGGILRCLTGAVLFANPLHFPVALAVFWHGALVTRQGWLGIRGGFILDDRGLRIPSDGGREPVPWGGLERIRGDAMGLVLRSRDGPTFRLSALAEGFWPALRWIEARLSEVS